MPYNVLIVDDSQTLRTPRGELRGGYADLRPIFTG
jgi:hypothetical protein